MRIYFKLFLLLGVIIIIYYTVLSRLFSFQYESMKINLFSSKDHVGQFCVVSNYWESEKEYSEGPHITLVLHATTAYLVHLEDQLETWTGGISVAVYIPTPIDQSTSVVNILQTQLHLRSVFSALSSPQAMKIKRSGKVSLHLFFRKKDFQPCPQLAIPENMFSIFEASLTDMKEFGDIMEIYPINTARNIARKNTNTELFISGDIEQLYVKNFERRIYPLAKKVLIEYVLVLFIILN